jgi:prephenate dehydrogenase
MSTDGPSQKTAGVVGLGLIGGSAAYALRDLGYVVGGVDVDPEMVARAVADGVIDHAGLPADADLTIVATPVDAIPEGVELALAQTSGWVTDTGSVKAPIAAVIDNDRFVPSHPMAGSEQSGLDGARAELFRGAAWVITPTLTTSDEAFAGMHDLVVAFGADPVTLDPVAHDRMVATVSHVPHLAAATLMNIASRRSDEHLAMLRLAAGGFRDMTRIAAGSPDIWPPICLQNGEAISEVLGEVIENLIGLRDAVTEGDSDSIRDALGTAREARVNLPTAVPLPPGLSEVRVRIKDQRGELAAITGLAAELDVNIFDLEIAHSAEGPTGVIVLLVDSEVADVLRGGLLARGYRPSVSPLS